MTQRQRTTIPELERLRALINDRDMTAAEVDRIEEELTDARAAVRTARDLNEADAFVARVANLESELARAEQRAQLAAEIVQRDARGLQETALRELRADNVRKLGPEAIKLDRSIIDTATKLLELFAKRRELEAQAGNEILGVPSIGGMTSVNPRNHGLPERSTVIAHFAMALQGLERHFAPAE